MSILANLPWNSTISLSMELSGDEASTELVLNPVTGIEGSRLQVRYAVLGLYEAGVTIAQESNFHELDAAFYMQNEEVGWIDIRPRGDEGLSSRLVPFYSSDVNGTTTMMANSERIIDSDDMNFALIISWDGVRVKAQDIFTAFLDGFAIAAEHNNTDIGAYIPAARSASGDMVLSTWTVGEAGNAEMNWKRMKRALIMMWDLLMIGRKGQKRSEGLVFGLEYKGVKIGAGRMLRFNKGSEAVGGSTVGK